MSAKDLTFLLEQLPGTTLTGAEVVKLASTWWDKLGRRIISKTFNKTRQDTHRGPGANGAPAFRVRGSAEVEIPSMILEGAEWELLDLRSRRLVCKAWLAEYRRSIYAPGKVLLPGRRGVH